MSDFTFELTEPALITLELESAQGPAGPTGPSGAVSPAVAFAYGDATPLLVAALDAGVRVFSIELAINTTFNGAGATLSVGTLANHELFLPATQIDPTAAGIYEASPNLVLVSATDVYLFITPGTGASQGSGSVSIHRQ